MIISPISNKINFHKRNTKIPPSPSFGQIKNIPVSQKIPLKRALFEKFIYFSICKLKNSKYSKKAPVRELEKKLEKDGINVRFKDDEKLANYIKTGIDILKDKGIEIPQNILFAPSFLIKRGLAVWSKSFPQKEAPIILSREIYKQPLSERYSSDHPCHTLFHEAGHWLHFQNNFDPEKNYKLWKSRANVEQIKNIVSQRAAELEDGSELCAETFAGIIAGKRYPKHIISFVEELGFPNLYLKKPVSMV